MLFKRTRELIENPKGVDVHRAAMSAALLGQTEVLTADGVVTKGGWRLMLRLWQLHLN